MSKHENHRPRSAAGRKIRFHRRVKKVLRVIAVMAGVAGIAYAFYFAATFGPRPVDAAAPVANRPQADMALVEESIRLEEQFNSTVGDRRPSEAEIELLRQAVALQREFNAAGVVEIEHRARLDNLNQRLVRLEAQTLAERSRASEEEAAARFAAGESAEAIRSIELAWELQQRINRLPNRTEFRDLGRETSLLNQRVTMETQPLHLSSIDLENRGRAAAEEGQWSEARRLLTEARDLQARINDNGRRNPFHDRVRQERLNTALEELRAGETFGEIERMIADAQEHETAERFEQAAQLYELAMMRQNEINRNHPQSRFVSTAKVGELDAARQSALSAPQTRQLESTIIAMRAALRRGDHEAARQGIADALRISSEVAARFPRSRSISMDERIELEYLDIVQSDLPVLQTALTENLVEIGDGWKMLRTEAPQRLYQRVMNANPSRNVGFDMPVDSLTRAQAREFCRRATWILGRQVKLPTREQYKTALGDWTTEGYAGLIRYEGGGAAAPTNPTTSGRPNSRGFIHLIGNVSQWLDDDGDGENTAWIAGGGIAERIYADTIFRTVSPSERSRNIGFRYVVADR